PEAVYRRVTIALPYVVVIGLFVSRAKSRGRSRLPGRSIACVFFRNKPLESLDDELCYPALLNLLPGRRADHPPLSFICTQYLDESFHGVQDEPERFRRTVQGMVSCLFDTGFNHHAEDGGTASWFTTSGAVDPRIASIEAWERATAEDPAFACTVPWLPSNWTVRSVTDHFLNRFGIDRPIPGNAPSLARFVMKHASNPAPSKPDKPR
ncbi:MAG: hypothetical protein HKN82_12285, partial [Akkermansiaceae bacterium]|nr:hypothetical protein [Akkermansiaceae bacterium]